MIATHVQTIKELKTGDFFEIAFHQTSIGMAILDADGKWIKVNQALCNLLGYAEEELLNKNFVLLTHKDDLPKNLHMVEQLKGNHLDSFSIEKRYIHKNGSIVWVNISISAVRDNLTNQLEYMISQIENITQRKIDEQQLQIQISSLQKFKKAIESTSDQIVITDKDGLVVFANHATEIITGYKMDEILHTKAGKLWGGLMSHEFYENLWKTIKIEKKSYTGILKNKRKGGEIYYAEIKISPILDFQNNISSFVGIERDITKDIQVDQMKSEFISLASHQLKTPLSAIKWLTEMLMSSELGPLTDKQSESLKNIYASNRRMLDIVGDLLNISKIESGKISLTPIPFKLFELVEDLLKELQLDIQSKNLHIMTGNLYRIGEIIADRGAIKNIISNLLTNAIKYSPKNGEIHIQAEITEKKIEISVQDNGMGIKQEEQQKIFSKFYRSQEAINYNPEGTGLGLYIIKLLVESMGGTISFESTVGVGTKFWFTIPNIRKSINGEFIVE